MRFGCCGCMISPGKDPIGIEIIETLSKAGYDYIELSLSHMAELTRTRFLELRKRIEASGLKCEACNNFVPGEVRLTGENVNMDSVMHYVRKALKRAAELETEIVVFGSAGARNVPDGFPKEKAFEQLVDFLNLAAPEAGQYGITLVIECLNKGESNIINSLEEGLRLLKQVNKDNVMLLVDYYHFSLENEKPEILLSMGDYISHVHFANVENRKFPKDIKEQPYLPFIDALKKTGYDGRVSIEAYTRNFSGDLKASLRFLRENFL
ncbi:MAG TPA: sugar phosphate isomerase/epimerase [Clostridiaceae bacterium]|nr:sugar phosphate isomerase/epimerase [Clostridiaceae bacterium]